MCDSCEHGEHKHTEQKESKHSHKTLWRPPIKDKDGRLTASGYMLLHEDLWKRHCRTCHKPDRTICEKECVAGKLQKHWIQKHIERHAEGTPINCVCDYATCDIMSIGKCKQLLSKEELSTYVEANSTLKVEVD